MSNSRTKKYFLIAIVIFVVAVGVFGISRPALALPKIEEGIATVLSWLISPFIWLLGKLIIVVINLVISVAQYNDFINATAVVKGWIIVRDICNMFFILILVFISLCTILKLEAYSYKKWLILLISMAIFINFSRTICGFIIDIGQVAMMTFVNAFKDTAAGNFTHALRLNDILFFRGDLDIKETGLMEIAGSLILALIVEIVALIVMFIILLVLVTRIIFLWILTVASPAVFLAHAVPLPMARKFTSQWWEKFTNYVIVGPVLAFFLWLALTVAATTPKMSDELHVEYKGGQEFTEQGGGVTAAITGIGESDKILSFIICIAFLMGGLMVTQQLGVAGGALAGKAVQNIQSAPGRMAKGIRRRVGKMARGAGRGLVERAESFTGLALQPKTWKKDWEARTRKQRITREAARIRKAKELGLPTPGQFFETYANVKAPWRLAQKMTGRAGKYRKRAEELGQEQDSIAKEGKIHTAEASRPLQNMIKEQIGVYNNEAGRLEKEGKADEATILRDQARSLEKNLKAELDIDVSTLPEKIQEQIKIYKDRAKGLGEEAVTLEAEGKTEGAKEKREEAKDLERRADALDMPSNINRRLREEKVGLQSRAEKISPSMMDYEDRITIQQAKYEELKRIQDIHDKEELAKHYEMAKDRGETTTMEAILMKLQKQRDFNEYLERRGLETSYKGLQQLVSKDFVEDLTMDEQQAFSIGNDLSLSMKDSGEFQIGCAYVTEEGPGGVLKYRETTEDEHNQWSAAEAKKIGGENFWRKKPRWSVFREKLITRKVKDPETGEIKVIRERVPLYDDYVKDIFESKFDSLYSEMIKREGRLPVVMEEYFAYPDVFGELEKKIESREIKLSDDQLKKWKDMKERLINTQLRKWGGTGEKPEASPEEPPEAPPIPPVPPEAPPKPSPEPGAGEKVKEEAETGMEEKGEETKKPKTKKK